MSELHARVFNGEPAAGPLVAAAPSKTGHAAGAAASAEQGPGRLQQIDAMCCRRGKRGDRRTARSLLPGPRNGEFTFNSPAMQAIERLVGRVAPTESTVLITGESGTGKGVSARRIHELSSRRDGPFLAVNCGAIPETLIESELFGHAKGAFTGAHHGRKGLFLQAERGTLFLDEIGEAPLSMQTKLLHALEAREVRALGSDQSRRIDVRIIAATNCDLPAMVAQGRFRQDLLFRLSMFQLAMPPLRQRRSDLPGLIRHLMAQRGSASGAMQALTIDPDAENLLVSFDWPGNVRQLASVLHRASILADGGCIRLADLPPEVLGAGPATACAQACDDGGPSLRAHVRHFELSLIRRAIDDAGGERRLAAQRLGIGLSSLYRKLGESLAVAACPDRSHQEGDARPLRDALAVTTPSA